MNSSKNYSEIQKQIASYLGKFLDRDGFEVLHSNENNQHACNIAMFIRDVGQVYIGHNLADKDYLLQLDSSGELLINNFEHVFVPGAWHRKRLLEKSNFKLRPEQIHLIGSPRVDILRENFNSHKLKIEEAKNSKKKIKVLWAPCHDRWNHKNDILSSYPSFGNYLDDPLLLKLDNFEWITVLHPRNRKNKNPITEHLVNADIVVSDYSSVIYEAWALGKPVIFPRWLLGEAVIAKAPASAEAHIYRERIGYHPTSFEEFLDLLQVGPQVNQEVHNFMRQYLCNYDKSGSAEQVSGIMHYLLERQCFKSGMDEPFYESHSTIEKDWRLHVEAKEREIDEYNAILKLPNSEHLKEEIVTYLWAKYHSYVSDKNWTEVEKVLHYILKYENSSRIYDYLADALRKQGKWWQEVESLQMAITLEKNDASLFYRLGEALEAMQRYSQAAQAYQSAINLKPGQADFFYRLGFVCEQKGHDGGPDVYAAEQAYKRAIELDKKLEASRFGIGVFHQHAGYWEKARHAYQYQIINTNLNDAALFYRLAMAHDRCYDWKEAEFYYRCAINLDFKQVAWHARLGFISERLGNYEQAVFAYKFAAINSSKHTPYWFYRWGYVLHKLGRYSEAAQAYLNGQTKKSSDQPKVGVESSLVPSHADAFNENKPSHDSMIDDDYAKTFCKENTIICVLESLLDACAIDANKWYQLGKEYENIGQWMKAADAYEQAILRQEEHNSEWYYRWGYVLSQAGEDVKACQALRDQRIFQVATGLDETKYFQKPEDKRIAYYTEFLETLPISNNTILYESFHGASVSCNPYAIFKKLIALREFSSYKHVWVLNDVSKVPPNIRGKRNVIFVKRDSSLYVRYLATAKFLINNNTFPPYFIRREEQQYLNTWHGIPWKTLGKEIKSGFWEYRNVSRNLLHATHITSPDAHTTRVLTEGHGVDSMLTAKVAHLGHPRVDMSMRLSMDQKVQIRELLDISLDEKIIFYAPTYRGSSIGLDALDFGPLKEMLSSLEEMEGWAVIFRGHHMMEKYLVNQKLHSKIIPPHIDTNEILAVTDVLITDYSSVAFDAIALNKSVIFYAYDYDEYRVNRGLYFDIEQMMGVFCRNVDEVMYAVRKIEVHNPSYYIDGKPNNEIENASPDFGAVDRSIDFFFRNIFDDYLVEVSSNAFNVLCYAGAFVPNGITSSFANLVSNIKDKNIRLIVAVDAQSVADYPERKEQFERIDDRVDVLPRIGQMNLRMEELWIHRELMRLHGLSCAEKWRQIERIYKREFKRIFGYSKLDVLINFEGYVRFWGLIFAMQDAPRKVIYLHNDMWEEHINRFPNQKIIFELYKRYDALISVSRETNEVNRRSLCERYGISRNSFTYANNLIDGKEIEALALKPLEILSDEALFAGGPIFVNIARLSVEKGHDQLIDAFARVILDTPNVKLLIIGDGPLYNSLNFKVKQLGLQNNIILLGWRKNPFPYLRKANCFVFSSRYEGQGLALLEAMVLKVPIICTDFSCAHDVLGKGRYGLIVENSVDGLVFGIQNFLRIGQPSPDFEHSIYQSEAMNMFYESVCNRVPLEILQDSSQGMGQT